MKKPRKHYTGEEKVAVLRRHLLEREAISKLCDELGLQPTVFYRWQKEFFENGAAAFQAKGRTDHQAEKDRIEFLEKKIQHKDEVLAELMGEYVALKKELGNSEIWGLGTARCAGIRSWILCGRWSEATEIGAGRFVGWLGVSSSKFYDWRERYGRVNEHNGWVPRDFWLEDWEKQAIINFHFEEPAGGLPAADVHDAGRRYRGGESVERLAGTGASRPIKEMERKAVAERVGVRATTGSRISIGISSVSYLNISGTFYYLCSVLDGYSRFLLHWELRASMTEADIEIILQESQGETSRSEAAHHFRQRSAIHRAGLQRVLFCISGMTRM